MLRAHFVRVCLELDLSKPLKRGFWLEDEEIKVFVVRLYEKLPPFVIIVAWLDTELTPVVIGLVLPMVTHPWVPTLEMVMVGPTGWCDARNA